MEAVDADMGLADRPCQQAIGLDLQSVHEQVAGITVVRLSPDALGMQVLPQRSAAGDVQDLDSAADAQRGEAVGDRPLRELQLDLVELRHQRQVAVIACDSAVASRL